MLKSQCIAAPASPDRRSLAWALAFHALDVEHHAAQVLVVSHRILGQHFLAGLVHDRAFPDVEAAVFQASLDLGDALAVAGVAFAIRLPLGLALGWLWVRRRSLLATIALHAAYNAVLVLATFVA